MTRYIIAFALLLSMNMTVRAQSVQSTENIGLGIIIIIEMANNNDVWVGSQSQGAGLYTASTQQWAYFNHANTPLFASDSVLSLVFGVINGVQHAFIGTTNGLVFNHGGVWDTLPVSLPDRHITGVSLVNDSLWAFTPSGVMVFDTTKHFIRNYSTGNSAIPFNQIITSQRGTPNCTGYVAGTPNNGAFYTNDYATFTKVDTSVPDYKLVDNRVTALLRDNNCIRNIIGTMGGLSLCPQGVPCQNYTTANGLPENWITSLSQDCQGRIWVGTRDSGVVIYSNGGTFTRVTTADGLSDNHVTSLDFAPGDCDSGHIATADGNINIVDSSGHIIRVINGIKDVAASNMSVGVYPQPAIGAVNFVFAKEINGDIALTDISGRTIKDSGIKNTSFVSLDVSSMPDGLYFYHITTPDEQTLKTGKVMVMR